MIEPQLVQKFGSSAGSTGLSGASLCACGSAGAPLATAAAAVPST